MTNTAQPSPSKISVEEAFRSLRNALRPGGTANVTVLRLKSGCAVNADVPQRAIDEIIKHHTLGVALGEPETACMQLAKILLADSAYLTFHSSAEPQTSAAEGTPQYVIQFDNGGYNLGTGSRNGFMASFDEATRYTKEEVLEKSKDLWGVAAILQVEPTGQAPIKESAAVQSEKLTSDMLALQQVAS